MRMVRLVSAYANTGNREVFINPELVRFVVAYSTKNKDILQLCASVEFGNDEDVIVRGTPGQVAEWIAEAVVRPAMKLAPHDEAGVN